MWSWSWLEWFDCIVSILLMGGIGAIIVLTGMIERKERRQREQEQHNEQ